MIAITLHEHANQAGVLVRTRLVLDAGRLAIDCDDALLPLPDGALEAVMRRYGKPLELEIAKMAVAERLELGEGRSVVRFRFRPRFDVIARDYVAFFAPDQEPLCELATAVCASLEHLARSARASQARR